MDRGWTPFDGVEVYRGHKIFSGNFGLFFGLVWKLDLIEVVVDWRKSGYTHSRGDSPFWEGRGVT